MSASAACSSSAMSADGRRCDNRVHLPPVEVDRLGPKRDLAAVGGQHLLSVDVHDLAELRETPSQRCPQVVGSIPEHAAEPLASLRLIGDRQIGQQRTGLARGRESQRPALVADGECAQHAQIKHRAGPIRPFRDGHSSDLPFPTRGLRRRDGQLAALPVLADSRATGVGGPGHRTAACRRALHEVEAGVGRAGLLVHEIAGREKLAVEVVSGARRARPAPRRSRPARRQRRRGGRRHRLGCCPRPCRLRRGCHVGRWSRLLGGRRSADENVDELLVSGHRCGTVVTNFEIEGSDT